ncbi:MAG: DNA-processing protein DprA [Bacteroidota bacterium]
MKQNKNKVLASIVLSLVEGVGDVLYKQLIDQLGSAQKIAETESGKLQSIGKISHSLQQQFLQKSKNYQRASELYDHHTQAKIKILAYENEEYPMRLKELHSPPSLLYYRGNTDLNSSRMISIVGTRNASNYGRQWVKEFVKDLKPYDVTIVSGLAYGIDIHAHKAALAENMATIAVLAGGLDHIYPTEHTGIAKEITSNGAILSEAPIGVAPERYHFPARNRIITGITDAVVIVEAGQKSGALITAQHADDLNREVFALPGNINQANSQGCNNLIKSHQATLVTSAKDLVDMMNWHKITENHTGQVVNASKKLSPNEQKIITALRHASLPQTIDYLSYQTKIDSNMLLSILLKLEQEQQVSLLSGNKYQLINN